jgi:quinol monooxygenase YgiN
MVIEHVDIQVDPIQQIAFEAAMGEGLRTILTRAKGMQGYTLDKCSEAPGRYVMRVVWRNLEDHMVSYRQGPLSPAFRALVESYFVQPVMMQHFEQVLHGDGANT